jgi:hypothetical protein
VPSGEADRAASPEKAAAVAGILGTAAALLSPGPAGPERGPAPGPGRGHPPGAAGAAGEAGAGAPTGAAPPSAAGAAAAEVGAVDPTGRPLELAAVLAGALTGRAGASLGWTGPIPAATALRLACDATVTRLLLDPAGQPLHLGRTRRLVSPGQWIALVTRDRGCIAPGCGRPPQWCEAHHIVPWVLGGTTDLDTLALLCRVHHRYTHEGRWTVVRDAHGRYTLAPPRPGTHRSGHHSRDPAPAHAA